MPHSRALHGDQGDAFLDGDRFHLRGAISYLAGHDGAFQTRGLGGVDVQGNSVLPNGKDTPRVQHLRPVAGNFLRLIVMQRSQQPRGRHGTRIGAEQTRHVSPNF